MAAADTSLFPPGLNCLSSWASVSATQVPSHDFSADATLGPGWVPGAELLLQALWRDRHDGQPSEELPPPNPTQVRWSEDDQGGAGLPAGPAGTGARGALLRLADRGPRG